MSSPTTESNVNGYAVWRPTEPTAGVAFVGRGAARPRREVLAATVGFDSPIAWLRQVHGDACVEAQAGCVGQADALTTKRHDIALAISTADCVPVVLLGSTRVAAIHAGWRGIVAGVVEKAVAIFAESSEAPAAWIGPAIGACCYEVGPDVADRVLAACGDPTVARVPPAAPRPHLDLRRAVAAQLRRSGVAAVSTIGACTHCEPRLHSFRRDGAAAGRNLAFAWLPPLATGAQSG